MSRGPRHPGVDALVAMRVRRRVRRLGHVEWFDVAYRAYLVAIIGGGLVLWASAVLGGAPAAGDLAPIARTVSAVVSLAAATAVMLGLRSGARGGPLAVESADVVHVLLAPLPRRRVLLRPAVQRLRTVGGTAGVIGGVAGQLAGRRLPGGPGAWAGAGVATGVFVGALWTGVALAAHGRPRRWCTALGAAVVAWQVIAVTARVVGPFDPLASVATSAWPDRPSSGGLTTMGAAPATMVVAVVVAVIVVGGVVRLAETSVEALARRGALVGQLRFAATMQDLRTVMLLRRQLDDERPRSRPWRPVGASPRGGPLSPARTVWRRGWQGLMRFPATRVARMFALAMLMGVAHALVARGTNAGLVVAAVAAFVLATEVLEPLSQEIDAAERADLLPVERGDLHLRHLSAPLVALVPFAVVGAVTAGLATGVSGIDISQGFAVAIGASVVPATVAAATGAVVSVVRDAPDPTRAPGASIAMPEVIGFVTATRTAWPLLVSIAGSLPVLFVRAAETSLVGAVVRSTVASVLWVGAVTQWVRFRDRVHRTMQRVLDEGRRAARG